MHAAEMAISNPLLDGAIKGASGLLISIVGGEDMRLMEIDEAANYIKDLIDPDADIFWGSAIDPLMRGSMRVSIVATGLDIAGEASRAQPSPLATLPAAVLPFTAKAEIAAPTLQPQAIEESTDFEPALGDLFAACPATLVSIPDAEEVLLLSSHNMRSTIISAPMVHEAIAPVGESDSSPPPGGTLFQRVAAMARGGSRARLESALPPVPERAEYPGAYDRRLRRNYASA